MVELFFVFSMYHTAVLAVLVALDYRCLNVLFFVVVVFVFSLGSGG